MNSTFQYNFLLDVKQQLDLINQAAKTEHQIREIRKLGQMIAPEASEEQNRQIAKKLIGIFFTERVKHPAKASIQRYDRIILITFSLFTILLAV